jgi:hypothetical protein
MVYPKHKVDRDGPMAAAAAPYSWSTTTSSDDALAAARALTELHHQPERKEDDRSALKARSTNGSQNLIAQSSNDRSKRGWTAGGCVPDEDDTSSMEVDVAETTTPFKPAATFLPAARTGPTWADDNDSNHDNDTGLPTRRGKLFVDCSGRTKQTGNQVFYQKLTRYGSAFLEANDEEKSEIIAQHFLDCFIFQRPIRDDCLTLGEVTASKMLTQALIAAGRKAKYQQQTLHASRSIVPEAVPLDADMLPTSAPTVAPQTEPPSRSAINGSSMSSKVLYTETTANDDRQVVYCGNGFDDNRQPGNLAFRRAIQSAHNAYIRADNVEQQELIVDIIQKQFQFMWLAADTGEWVPGVTAKIRRKVKNALRNDWPEGTDKSVEKSSNSALRKTIAGGRIGTVRNNASFDPIGSASNKPVVHFENRYRECRGNLAYRDRIEAIQDQYYTCTSAERRAAMIDAILDGYEFRNNNLAMMNELSIQIKVLSDLVDVRYKRDRKRKAEEEESDAMETETLGQTNGSSVAAPKKIVVQCGLGCREDPGHLAYRKHLETIQNMYFARTTSTLHRELLVDEILARFDFQLNGRSEELTYVRHRVQAKLIQERYKQERKRKAAMAR